jgi:hypothetical protein
MTVIDNLKFEENIDKCDSRIWSGACEHDKFANIGEKYLCVACGTIPGLDHEVSHEIFPHIKGDTDNLY